MMNMTEAREICMHSSKRGRGRGNKYAFSEAETKILLSFVKENSSSIEFVKLWKYCIVDLNMAIAEFYEAYLSLIKKEILTDKSISADYTMIHSLLVDIPAVVKNYLGLKYYDSASILTTLYKSYSYVIAKNIECEFMLWNLIHLRLDIRQRYEYKNNIFRQSIHELIKRNYLVSIDRKRYKFNYKVISQEIIAFLSLA